MSSTPQLPPAWKPYVEAAYAAGLRLTNAALGPGRSSRRLDDLLRRLQRELDMMIAQAFDSLPGGGLACTAGCAHCCRTLHVTASPLEVFGLVRRLRATHLSDADLAERIAALADVQVQRIMPPCPLLDADGLCLVYTSRPLACRGCASADASLCEAAEDDHQVPRSMAHQLGAAAMMGGVTEALKALGLAGQPVELRSALALALADETAEKRWLRGENVFGVLSAAERSPL